MKPLAVALLSLAGLVALPTASRAALSVSVAPAAYLTERGGDGGEPVVQLAAADQTGSDDDPSRYVTFTTPDGRYRGTRSFVLPPEAPAATLQGIALKVSFRTASPARTKWKWKIYDTRKRRFVKLGTSKGAVAGVWSVLEFEVKPVKGDLSRFVDPASGELRIRFQSSDAADDVRVDQEELQLLVREPPSLGSCPLLPADHWWNARIDSLPADPQSDDYVQALGANTGVHPDFGAGLWQGAPIGIPWTSVSAGQPLVPVSFYYEDSDPGPYPIPPDAPIEGGPQSNGDRHVLVVDNDACLLYEIFDAHPGPGDGWEGGSGAVFDLQSNALRPDGWTSADAAGFAILPGLVRYPELAGGEIAHALRFTATDIRYAYSWPARHRATCGGHGENDLSVPPMGQRFRLKGSFDVSGYSQQVQVILVAMQRYGIVLADCGSNWYVSGAPDPGFDDDALVSELATVKGSDFEAVDTSSLQVDPDSAQVQPPAP